MTAKVVVVGGGTESLYHPCLSAITLSEPRGADITQPHSGAMERRAVAPNVTHMQVEQHLFPSVCHLPVCFLRSCGQIYSRHG